LKTALEMMTGQKSGDGKTMGVDKRRMEERERG
jgi:hypothetical protein